MTRKLLSMYCHTLFLLSFSIGFAASESGIWSSLVSQFSATSPSRCERDGSSICLNHGTCVDLPESRDGFYCVCANGYDGTYCQTEIDDCIEHECPSGAVCIDQIGHYTCECPSGLVGDRCQYTDKCLDTNPCVFGSCQTDAETGFAHCMCVEGHYGPRCEYKLDICMLKPCQNGGICKAVGNELQCQCQKGFAGSHCEICAEGFFGPQCTDKAVAVESACKSVTCDHGECNVIENQPICVCNTGYTGDQCELNIDDCARNPCLNNGKCIDGIADYICECRSGFSGSHCETLLRHPCSRPNTCNLGHCRPVGTFGAFTCVCPEGVDGQYCDRLTPPPSVGNCDYTRCLKLVNNGYCNTACFRQGCHIDLIDCNPFARCQHPEYCRNVAKNGVCDAACDNAACLHDGGDCVRTNLDKCPLSCMTKQSNGVCDTECNTEVCSFDGSDCLESSFTDVADVIALRIAENPADFNVMKLKELISHFSKFVGVPVGLRVESDGSPAVYVWTPRTGRAATIHFEAVDTNFDANTEDAIEIELLIDFHGCNETKLCRFITPAEVIDYLKTESLNDIVAETGFPIFDAVLPVKITVNWKLYGTIASAVVTTLLLICVLCHCQCRKIVAVKTLKSTHLHNLLRSPMPLNDLTPSLFALVQNLDNNGQSVLHAAVTSVASKPEHAILNDMRLLLATGLVSIEHRDTAGFTALHWAIKTGRFAAVQYLLTEGASPNATSADGLTPLYLAVEKSDPSFVLLLLAQPGINVNAPIDANMTPLKHCTHYDDGRLEHMKAILRHPHIDINAVGNETVLQCRHQTVVHEAVYWGNFKALRLLIRCRADLNAKDHCGRTPLAFAIENIKLEHAELLIQNISGDCVNDKDEFGRTPAELAHEKGFNNLADMILHVSTAPVQKFAVSLDTSSVSTPEASFFDKSLPQPMTLVREKSNLSPSQSFDSDLHLQG